MKKQKKPKTKHLIYLGYTGTAHRIALFDETNIITRNVPVKDVPELSDDLEFLNCTVKKGTPIPNLMGSKVLCSVAKGHEREARFDYSSKRTTTEVDLRAFPNREAKYIYKFDEWGFGGSELLSDAVLDIWDGMCKEHYIYIIAGVLASDAEGNWYYTNNYLCMTHTGSLFFMTNNTATVLRKAGAVFVQVGTPEIKCSKVLGDKVVSTEKHITVGIPQDMLDKVIWVGRRKKEVESIRASAEYIWWGGGSQATVYDMRSRYPAGRVVGISGCAEDASVVILPDKVEEVWLGMFYECSSLQAIYIPDTVEVLHEIGLPPRRFKNVTIYSNSPLVQEFCTRRNVAYKPCASADAMLADYLHTDTSDFISVSDASNIAALAGAQSSKVGASGTLWSAILFSFSSKGIATEELQRRYPVVETCDCAIPLGDIQNVVGVTLSNAGIYGKERCRVMAAAFTQFYPLKEYVYFEGSPRPVIYKFPMCDYNLYILKDVTNIHRLPRAEDYFRRNHYVNFHIAMLEDVSKNRIIHSFECNDLFVYVLSSFVSACYYDKAPSGALRFAEKLPSVYNHLDTGTRYKHYAKDVERYQFIQEVLHTLMPVMYNVKTYKFKFLGIDLHTGNLVLLDYAPYINGTQFADIRQVVTLAGVQLIKKFKIYPENDKTVKALLAPDCVYYQNN